MKYGFGRGNWLESAIVGIAASIIMLIAMPFMVIGAVCIFVAGITGFLVRED